MKTVAETLGVARSNLVERLKDRGRPRQRHHKAEDALLLPLIRRVVDERPTCGYRRITALLNRQLAAEGRPPANHKRVYRLMKVHGLLLARHTGERPGRAHDGKVVVMASNLRWCSDGFEFTCWNGEIVRAAFVIDAHDREIIAWKAVAGAGVSGSDIRDMMLEATEKRFGAIGAPHPVRMAVGQRLALHGDQYATLRRPAEPDLLLHARRQPTEQRHERGLRQNHQARPCPGEPDPRRQSRA